LFIFKHNTSLFNTDNYGTIAELCPLKRWMILKILISS
jgi:hypothetical protein